MKTDKSDAVTPYLNARRVWNSHTGTAMAIGRMGIAFGLLSLMIVLAAVGGLIYANSQSKFVPLVFQQDASGNIISMTRADRVSDARVDDFRLAVCDFVSNIRLVTPDVQLQNKAAWRVFGYLSGNDPAAGKATEYVHGSKEADPFARAATEMVSIDIKSVLQQTETTWQIDWVETIRTRDGTIKVPPYRMRALVSVYQNPTADLSQDAMFVNPHFIFIKDFNWSKQL